MLVIIYVIGPIYSYRITSNLENIDSDAYSILFMHKYRSEISIK